MGQEAALTDVACSSLRRLLAFNMSFNCTEAKIGDPVLFYEAQSKQSTPRWRGPALILEIGETGVTAKFQSQVFKVARFCARDRGEEKGVVGEELDPVRARLLQTGSGLGAEL